MRVQQNQNQQQAFQPFQSRLGNNLIANYASQQQENISQNVLKQQNLRQQHLFDLQKQFEFTQQDPSEVLGVMREELILTLIVQSNFKIPIKIVLEENFPHQNPKIFTQQKYQHPDINESTFEINYFKFAKWDSSQKLTNLIMSIKNRFNQVPPQPDAFVYQIENWKNKCKEKELYDGMMLKNMEQIFGQDKNWSSLCSKGQYEEIYKLPEYRELAQYILDLIEKNEEYSRQLLEKYSDILSKRQEVSKAAEVCENKKYELMSLFKKCQMITERFDKSKILALMEQEIQLLEDQSAQEQFHIGGNQQQGQDQMMNCQQYFMDRKRLYKLKAQKEKLEQIL